MQGKTRCDSCANLLCYQCCLVGFSCLQLMLLQAKLRCHQPLCLLDESLLSCILVLLGCLQGVDQASDSFCQIVGNVGRGLCPVSCNVSMMLQPAV